jgi:hypothetical protein
MTDGALASVQIAAVRPDRAEEHATAERVLAGPLRRRVDLVGVQSRPGSGRTDGEFLQDERWFLKSRATRVHRSRAGAMAALDRLYADKRALGELAPSRTILFVTADGGERYQLWTLAPRLVTLREELDTASAAGAWDSFTRSIAGYNAGLSAALASSIEGGLCIDASPSNFARQWGRLRYIDDDVTPRRDALGIEDAFVGRFGEYPAPDSVWDEYIRQFARDIAARVPRAQRIELRLEERLRSAAVLRRGAVPYVARLLETLEAA